ncbi:MAG: hypothetical protein JWN40_291 [Phycisphaerales bacterium]|nr:hypothetical protein [Phycisphaerales bacterium]
MSQILHAKITTVRRKHVIVATAVGVAGAIGAFALILAIGMLLDLWIPSGLPYSARAALLSINLAAVVWIILYATFGPILYGPDDDEIALMVEDAEPAFRTRLIASIQLSRPGEAASAAGSSPSLVRAMIAQAESLAGPIDFSRVIKTDRLLRVILLSLLILIVGAAAFAWGGDTSKDLFKRAFLSNVPVPRKTRVLPVTDNLLIARGDTVEILALADGVIPPTGQLTIKTEAGRKQDFTMERVTPVDDARLQQAKQLLADSQRDPKLIARVSSHLDASAPLFAATIENVQEPFDYTIRLNDGASETFKVNVLPRPAITKVEAKQIYPAYTGRPIEPRPLGDLSILQGSKLQLAITVNKNLHRPAKPSEVPNFVHLIGSDKNLPLKVDDKDARILQGEFDIPKGTTGFSINLTDEYGLKSKDPAIYRIDLLQDKPPAARIILPTRKEVLLVRDAKHKVIFEATDDFAIGAAGIRYKLDDGPESTIKLDLKGQHPRNFRGEYDWKLNEVQSTSATRPMMEGSVIEYWIEVEDTKDAPNGGPGKGVSEHYMVRVVSEAEKRAEMAARIADIGSGLRTAADDQEAVANKVGTILLEKKPGASEPAPK